MAMRRPSFRRWQILLWGPAGRPQGPAGAKGDTGDTGPNTMKLLYNTHTEQILPWPRIDDEPIVGLDPALLVMTVIEGERPSYDPATQILTQSDVVSVEAKTVTRSWAVSNIAFTAEQWASRFLTSLQIIGLQRLEMALITGGKTLGPAMAGMKA